MSNFKKFKNKSMHWKFAIVVATLLYLLLMLLFSSANDTKTEHSTNNKPQNYILPIAPDGKNQEQHQIYQLLQVSNPTLIIKPNQYGYSSILGSNFILHPPEKTSDKNSIPVPHFFLNRPVKVSKIQINPSTSTGLLSRLDFADNSPQIPDAYIHYINPKLKFPYTRDYYTGKQFSLRFNEEINDSIKKHDPQKPTILTINVPTDSDFLPIITVTSSCGSPELDDEALKTLTNSNLAQNHPLLKGKQIKLYVVWK